MSSSVVVTISLLAEKHRAGPRCFATAHFVGDSDGERISGFFDYSYTPYASAEAAVEDAVTRVRKRLVKIFGVSVQPVIKIAEGSPPEASKTLRGGVATVSVGSAAPKGLLPGDALVEPCLDRHFEGKAEGIPDPSMTGHGHPPP